MCRGQRSGPARGVRLADEGRALLTGKRRLGVFVSASSWARSVCRRRCAERRGRPPAHTGPAAPRRAWGREAGAPPPETRRRLPSPNSVVRSHKLRHQGQRERPAAPGEEPCQAGRRQRRRRGGPGGPGGPQRDAQRRPGRGPALRAGGGEAAAADPGGAGGQARSVRHSAPAGDAQNAATPRPATLRLPAGLACPLGGSCAPLPAGPSARAMDASA